MDKFVVKVKRHLSSCETDQGKKPRKVFIDRCQNSRPTCPQSKEQPQASGATGSDDVSPNPLSMYKINDIVNFVGRSLVGASGPTIWTSAYGLEPVLCKTAH